MAAYSTGNYWLLCFDSVGRRDKRFEGEYETFSEAQEQGSYLCSEKSISSFCVDRRLFNSIDERVSRW